MIITIAGTEGSGKTTISREVAKRLGYQWYSAGNTRRKLAEDKGMTLQEFNKLGETESFTDKDVDYYLYTKKVNDGEDNFITEGRTGFYFIPHSIKIFITCSLDRAARRMLTDKINLRSMEIRGKDIEEQIRLIKERQASDKLRYHKWYGIDYLDRSHYDFILDTTDENDVEKNVQKVLDFLKSKGVTVKE